MKHFFKYLVIILYTIAFCSSITLTITKTVYLPQDMSFMRAGQVEPEQPSPSPIQHELFYPEEYYYRITHPKPQIVLPLTFDPEDITKPSNITKEQLTCYLSHYCYNWIGLEDYLLSLDKDINLIFLLSVARAETGGGRYLANYYNSFNIKSQYGFAAYSSYQDGIDAFYQLILQEYLNSEGDWYEESFYNHPYSSIHTIGVHYGDKEWAEFIISICYESIYFLDTLDFF